jgi:hypothetical protein
MSNRAKRQERDELRRRGLPVVAEPSAALDLLYDRALLEWAANPWLNSHWHSASMMTRGRDGLTVSDAFASPDETTRWVEKANALLRLDLGAMMGEVPALKVRPIEKKKRWDAEYDPTLQRDIVVPCILRRVLSSNLAYILEITTKGQLPMAARAYVPGRVAPASTVAKEVARLTQRGHFFYAKLDLRDAFNSIPWRPLRRALLRMGYPQRFVDILMLFVRAPVERFVRGRWLRQPRYRGALAGLPESGILLNVLMAEVDARILRLPNVYYARYSDDMIITGLTASDVARAANVLMNWAWGVGLEIKGVPQRTDARRLVRDIRETRLELLGAEIDHRGDIHIPQSKIDAQRAKIEYFQQQAAHTSRLIAGLSKYAAGARGATIATADQDDLDEMVEGFFRYWLPLNRAEAELFRSSASRRVSFGTHRKGDGPYRKLFAALLGRERAHPPSRAGGGSGSPCTCSSDWIERDVLPLVVDCLAFDLEDREAARRPAGAPTLGIAGDSQAAERLASSAPGLGTIDPGALSPVCASSSCEAIGSEDLLLCVDPPSHQGVGFDLGASGGPDGVATPDTAPADPGDRPARTMGWSPGELAKAVFCFVDVRALDHDTVVVALQEFANDGLEWRPRRPILITRENTERSVAYLQTLVERRKAASAQGRAFVGLGPSWLPKQMLVTGRAFRRIGIFQLLAKLHHAPGPQRGLVVGPIQMPAQLAASLNAHIEHGRRQKDVHTDHGPGLHQARTMNEDGDRCRRSDDRNMVRP